MPNRVILVRHGDEPSDDRVYSYLARSGYDADIRKPFKGESLDLGAESIAGVVVYGGPYAAYDTAACPFLNDEYSLIRRALDADVPMLGICQGAQMIAWHLGADVGPPESKVHEFGYYELRPTPDAGDFLPGPLHVAQSHWHGFELPRGATHLASSELYPNQAFRIGDRVFGFQFHAEVTSEGFRRMQARGGGRYGLPGVQPREEQDRLMALHDAAQAAWFNGFLEKLFPPLA